MGIIAQVGPPDSGSDDYAVTPSTSEPPRPPTPIGFEVPPQNSEGAYVVPTLDAGARFGVPSGYDPGLNPEINRADTSIRNVESAYYPSDLDNILAGIRDPRQIENIQASLVYIGILNKTDDVIYGEWDNKSAAAFEELLAVSNRAGSTWNRTLARMLRSDSVVGAQPTDGPRGPSRAPFRAQIPNQAEVKEGFANVRSGMLGGQWARDDDAELSARKDEFASDFTGEVVGAQRAAYDGASTVEQAPSLEFSAQERVKRDEAAGVNANLFRGYADAMTRALGGG